MAAQIIRSHSSLPQQQRFTLVLRNGQLLRHQDSLVTAQFRHDARVVSIQEEGRFLDGRREAA